MQYIRCKCGKSTGWTSYGQGERCVGCPDCGTTLDTGPDLHETPIEHEFVTRFDSGTGKPYKKCARCMKEVHE